MFAYSRYSVMAEWASHTAPIVAKLTTYPRYEDHCSKTACAKSSADPGGTAMSRTSSVIAMAKTPSLNAPAERSAADGTDPRPRPYPRLP
ncbi:hypothetical protein OG948_57490 (plasmid) [Embleya sp. NBC_00888]|nr:hypothetical protein OG948_57490 [Embleya sp. NBC_00888]